jgi:hemoglobin
MRVRMLIVACVWACGLAASAQPPAKKPVEKAAPLDRAELDRRAARAAYDTAKLGSDLWAANQEATLRLYQGSLMALQPMLDHRPKLAAYVKECLELAETMTAVKGAFILRDALDAIQKDCWQAPAAAPVVPKKATLWTRLGGEKTVKAVVRDTVEAAMKDPKVNFSRGGKYKFDDKRTAALEENIVDFMSSVLRGPLEYTGRDVSRVHRPMKITGAEYDAFVGHFAAALKKNKVAQADADELLRILAGAKVVFVAKE